MAWLGSQLTRSPPRPSTAAGRPSLRRAPAVVNLAWARELGWDGRGGDLVSWLPNHAKSQLDQSLDDAAVRLAASSTYAAHLVRAAAGRGHGDTVLAALAAFVQTRFAGASPWDAHEAGSAGAVTDDVVAGYQLFVGKALCGSCHPPPLYTDHDFHRLGLIASPDDGRGRVDPAQAGAFKTPGLRGAAARARFFHDGSAASLDAAIDWHLAGGRGQGALERAHLRGAELDLEAAGQAHGRSLGRVGRAGAAPAVSAATNAPSWARSLVVSVTGDRPGSITDGSAPWPPPPGWPAARWPSTICG